MPSSSRRVFLASVGTIAAGGFAGCTGLQSPEAPSEDGASPCPTTVPLVEEVDYRGESRVVCNDGTDTEEDTTQLVPDSRTLSLPDASATFVLSNHRETYFNTNHWSLEKRVDGTWYDVSVPVASMSALSVAPDTSHEWTITVDNSDLNSVIQPVEGTDVTVRCLGSGTYALLVSGSYGEQSEHMKDNTPWIAYATQFSIEGESLTLEPTTEVTDVRRRGDTITVQATSDEPNYTVTVRELAEEPTTDRAEHHHKLITEQLYRHRILRNALPYFEDDVTEVTVEITAEQRMQAEPPLSMGQSTTIRYQETDYSVDSNPV